MSGLGFLSKIIGAGLILGALVACSGLNLGTAGLLQSVDVFEDDISGMSFAIDAPHSVLPQDGGMLYKMDATTRELGERHIAAVLVRGDDIRSFSGLKPPASNRTYHLFAFSETDKEKISEFQSWIRNIKDNNEDAGGELTMEMDLQFCRTVNVDVNEVRVTVYVSLPGQTELNPLFSNVKLSEIGGPQSGELPVCVQT